MRFDLGELFCGPGGMAIASTRVAPVQALGGETYTLHHSWGVDFSQPAIDTFNANLGGGICMDAWEFVRNHLDRQHRINALAFGFPCNSFSEVGERKGMDDPNFGKLYQTGIAVLDAYAPLWFVAENVSGISARDNGNQFRTILRELSLAGKGYDVVAHLYRFEEYGVPQARHRYVIVGIRSDVAARNHLTFRPPAPTHGKGREPFVSCAAALAHVPPGPVRMPSERIVWRLRFTAPGDNAWKLDELADPEKCPDDKLDAYLRQLPWYADEIAPLGPLAAIRTKIAEVKLNCKAARMSHIYRRLDPARPAYTLTGSGGGGTHVYHWREHRALTNAERAALQTFPANFIFKGTLEQVRKQIGMAVPTRGAEAIFRAILHTFAHVDYPFVHPDPALVFANGHCRTELPFEG